MNTSGWVRPAEAADILGVNRKTVYTRIETGIIPASALAPRLPGQRTILISRQWLDGQTVNVSALPQRLHPADKQELIEGVANAVIARLFPASQIKAVG